MSCSIPQLSIIPNSIKSLLQQFFSCCRCCVAGTFFFDVRWRVAVSTVQNWRFGVGFVDQKETKDDPIAVLGDWSSRFCLFLAWTHDRMTRQDIQRSCVAAARSLLSAAFLLTLHVDYQQRILCQCLNGQSVWVTRVFCV